MSDSNTALAERADEYCRRRGILRSDRLLGQGKDGTVWPTSRHSAVKPHERPESYQHERNAYIRFQKIGLKTIAGFSIPRLIDHDDDLCVIEIELVSPPFIVDFASARIDVDPQFIEDEGNTLEDFVRSRFDDRTDIVMGIYYELIRKAGIYLTDLHPHNIKFAD